MDNEVELAEQLKRILRSNESFMHDLQIVASLQLPQCYIAAGYIRNMVWDHLHRYPYRAAHDDIDVVYFDPEHLDEEKDREIEHHLVSGTGNVKWSVKNQARMHIRNGNAPYLSTEDALMRWPETVTSIGAKLNDKGQLELCCPNGLSDLFRMQVRQSRYFEDRAYYLERIGRKAWRTLWPKLIVVE
ncbi:nucleotidyltransferase family protein [Paenibacillus lignilyticus]|uniref:Nucleotidyltransferase family protein n=1 Tax=Paenibacillus lignilyticus TaxID=1172615 RepID=A0ABS5C5P2_9BACL|nr:nucleotidyltransferase family protein [Paenibacillus lignilyticus]MBP3961313.1 nucleotidyltransferase family protein [Paenibacillus lignilyticus]